MRWYFKIRIRDTYFHLRVSITQSHPQIEHLIFKLEQFLFKLVDLDLTFPTSDMSRGEPLVLKLLRVPVWIAKLLLVIVGVLVSGPTLVYFYLSSHFVLHPSLYTCDSAKRYVVYAVPRLVFAWNLFLSCSCVIRFIFSLLALPFVFLQFFYSLYYIFLLSLFESNQIVAGCITLFSLLGLWFFDCCGMLMLVFFFNSGLWARFCCWSEDSKEIWKD